eukprot:GAHX01000052.1.p1 GENE.GAHX01000052.1~~GAHX01000052.1.p1  ORF type:complete len:142 (+),score=44.75 GAHX01000052.1:45-428(+)
MTFALLKVGAVVELMSEVDEDKLAVIIDFFDHTKVLIDGPEELTGVTRAAASIKHLKPVGFEIDIKKGASSAEVKAAMEKDNILSKYKELPSTKNKTKRIVRSELTDFERFKAKKLIREREMLLSKN